jgi:hypothetical protein
MQKTRPAGWLTGYLAWAQTSPRSSRSTSSTDRTAAARRLPSVRQSRSAASMTCGGTWSPMSVRMVRYPRRAPSTAPLSTWPCDEREDDGVPSYADAKRLNLPFTCVSALWTVSLESGQPGLVRFRSGCVRHSRRGKIAPCSPAGPSSCALAGHCHDRNGSFGISPSLAALVRTQGQPR